MLLVTREQWNARYPKRRTPFFPSQSPTGHWNGPTIKVRGNTSWDHVFCSSLVRGIQNFHMDSRGWSDIAYNWLVCPHSYVFEGRGLKYQNGANGTATGNKSSPAICFLLGEDNTFTGEAKIGFVNCCKYIVDHSSAKSGAKGHRDWKSTACPGDEIYKWIKLGMPVPYMEYIEEEDFPMFESHEERVKYVQNAYRKIAKREPGGSEVDFWVYAIALNPVNSLNLIVDLHGEK